MNAESVKVVVRCRPFSDKEKAAGHSCIVAFDDSVSNVSITNIEAENDPPKVFTFDSVFDWNSQQQEVYNKTALPIVNSVLNGYNGTILAYGQTGTGKTFSMEGIRHIPELRGIIPNSFEHIFSYIHSAGAGIKFLVRASYLEIYNEEIRDLLSSGTTKLELKEHPETGIYVKDLSSFVVKDVEEMDKIMSQGNKNRSVGFTQMNAQSSRSHSIFTITIEMSEIRDGKECIRMGKLNLVDLAGSERQTKTGATGERLKEATKINLSLSCLGNVIKALVDGKSSHIPYRDSKLTRLLQDSLGGNAKTMMIATLSPASYNYDETVSTLRYAARAKNIKNKPKINEDPKDAMLRMFQEEIQRLKEQLENSEECIIGVEDSTKGSASESDETDTSESDSTPMSASKEHIPKKKAGLTLDEMRIMEQRIEDEKRAILESKDMIETEKQALLKTLAARQDEIDYERKIREELVSKLEQMESKLLVGGVNLLDKEAQQREELARQAEEAEERNRQHLEMQRQMQQEEEAALQMEEEYNSLQEETAAKTTKIKKLWTILMNHKAELNDLTTEYQREREDLLDTIRELSRELKYKMKLVERFIPEKELQLIESNAVWDEVNEQWHIRFAQYAGNNHRGRCQFDSASSHHLMRHKKSSATSNDTDKSGINSDNWTSGYPSEDIYLTYGRAFLGSTSPKSTSAKSNKSNNSSTMSGTSSGRPQAARGKSGARSGKPASNSTTGSGEISINLIKDVVPSARGLVSKPRHYA